MNEVLVSRVFLGSEVTGFERNIGVLFSVLRGSGFLGFISV